MFWYYIDTLEYVTGLYFCYYIDTLEYVTGLQYLYLH